MSTTTLKLLALFLMLVDHIGQFIPGTPIELRWLGRISAPLFMYTVVWGFTYTSNKSKYLQRLYLFGVIMALINITLNYIYNDTHVYITNNFITPLFLIGFVIYTILQNKKTLYIGFAIWQVVSTLLCFFFVGFVKFPNLSDATPAFMFYGSLFGNIFFVEGGILFIILGALLYLTRNDKLMLIIFYSGFSTIIYFLVRKFSHMRELMQYLLPFADFQWMMIAALPFMLIYNHNKGIGLKYFFYFFYPIHIIILYLSGLKLGN